MKLTAVRKPSLHLSTVGRREPSVSASLCAGDLYQGLAPSFSPPGFSLYTVPTRRNFKSRTSAGETRRSLKLAQSLKSKSASIRISQENNSHQLGKYQIQGEKIYFFNTSITNAFHNENCIDQIFIFIAKFMLITSIYQFIRSLKSTCPDSHIYHISSGVFF